MIHKKCFSYRCKQFFLILALIALAVACGGKKKTNESLQQAFKLHQEAVNIRNQMADQLAKLTTNGDSSFVEAYKTDLDSISRSLKAWDEQLVGVPGFEKAHDHLGHDHHHNEPPELTPAQHRQVQQHLLQEIRKIEQCINQIKGQP